MKNPCAKTRDVSDPYEIWQAHDWEWRVLKKYQTPEQEAKNPLAIWFCAVQSPFTNGRWEYGDTYVKDIKSVAVKIDLELLAIGLKRKVIT